MSGLASHSVLRRLQGLLRACCVAWLLCLGPIPCQAVILWSDSGSTLAHDTGSGHDILEGAVKRDDSSNDTLYFKFRLNPLSDTTTEDYFAAFELYERDSERLGVGNALKAWAYSAFFNQDDNADSSKPASYIDLRSSKPEAAEPGGPAGFEFPRRGVKRTIVFKVQYVAGGDDLVTVWLNPDLGPGANEVYQPESLTTRFSANASFDEIRLRHLGGGPGWVFEDMAIATSFSDFVDTSSAKPLAGPPLTGPGNLPLSFQSWQREQGMPHNAVRALAQTPDGYLWLGSDDGLARFDGVRFVVFDSQKGMRNGPVRTLFQDSHGGLWIGMGGSSLAHYEDGRFTFIDTRLEGVSNAVTALAEDTQNRLWIGTTAGLVVWQNHNRIHLDGAEPCAGKPITALHRDPNGTLWLAAAGAGVFRFQNHQFTPVTDPSVDGLLREAHSLLMDHAGRLWVGAGEDSVLCCEGAQWHRYRLPHHAATPRVNALAEEPDGTVWAGSAGEGLFQFKAGGLAAVNGNSGLADNMVGALLIDREGKLWVGTDSGLNRLQHKNLFILGQDNGLGYGALGGLAEVSAGVIWAVKPNDGLYRWEGRSFNRLTAAGLWPHDPKIGALLAAQDGSCWVACSQGLLRFKDPQAVADEYRLVALSNATIIALAEDPGGSIWAGTREGELWRLQFGAWSKQYHLNPSNAITALLPGPDGSMWIGTEGNGLYRFKEGVRDHYTRNNGLLSNSIRTLAMSPRGLLWIGTAEGGLTLWRNERLTTFTTREGLPDNTISQILEDDAGRLWLGGNRGIACVSKRNLEELADGKNTALFPHVYGRMDGMPSEECSGGFFPAGLRPQSGLLWFSTLKGIVVIDPHHRPTNAPAPPVVIEEVLVDGAPIPEFSSSRYQSLQIVPGRHRFEIQYTGLSFDAPEQMRFRYRLEGWDTNWMEAGTRRTADYNYVPPGHYQFRIIACDSEGIWNEVGASLGLVVSHHFWQTWWAISLASAALLATVGGTARIAEKRRLQRRLKRLEQERALERERTRIAQDLHDEMGAKLCRISFLSEHARRNDGAPPALQEQIVSISDASRELLHSLDEIVWAVNPQNDTLEHVASYIGQYAQDYFQMTGIECELDIPSQLPPHPVSSQTRHHLFRAVHEAFTNILKHSKATRAHVSIVYSDAAFEIVVSDNGIGLAPALLTPSPSNSAIAGDGLRNMRRRLSELGGHCQIDSPPQRGTTIRFRLPLSQNDLQKAIP